MKTSSTRDPMAAVEPTLRAGLTPLLRMLSRRRMTLRMVRCIRWIERRLQGVLGRGVPSRKVPGNASDPDVRVFVIDRRGSARRKTPAVLHIHGGGYVSGTPAMMFKTLATLSSELDCLVVSVDYRRAPETRFPGSLEDNYAALRWLHANAGTLAIDPARIAVLGESAGGGHAATLAIAARDRGEFALAFQVLLYPMLDDRTGSVHAPSSPDAGVFLWTATSNIFGWTSLLGVPAGAHTVPRGAVPARVEDLAGLPDAWIGVGTLDLFHEEDLAYAKRLEAAGVRVQVESVRGAYHAFDALVPKSPVSRAFTASWFAALRGAFERQARDEDQGAAGNSGEKRGAPAASMTSPSIR